MITIGILLAAGRSERFGKPNKLLSMLGDKPLIRHAADALLATSVDALILVTRSTEVAKELPEFEVVNPGIAALDQSGSLRHGVSAAIRHGAEQVLITLGDMPLLTSQILNDVIQKCSPNGASAATDGALRTPPACFPKSQFENLMALSGDEGARDLIATASKDRLTVVRGAKLQDVDTVEDLKVLRERWENGGR